MTSCRAVWRSATVWLLALASQGCAKGPAVAPEQASGSASAVLADPGAASATAGGSTAAPAASSPAKAEKQCICATFQDADEHGEYCLDGMRECIERRLKANNKSRALSECLPAMRAECVSFGCKGEKCYRLK